MIKKAVALCLFIGAVFTLFQLSYWQVERMEWKRNIIEQLDNEYQKNPSQNQYSFTDLQALKAEESPIRYGQVSGKFIYDKQIFVGPKTHDNNIGYHVVTPLKLTNGGYILVNIGWVPESFKDTSLNATLHENVAVQGIMRKTDWNRFTSNNSPENNIWMKLDLSQIAQAKDISPVASVMLFANNISYDVAPIILQETKWYPRNKHKQYAIFWATMGFALIIVFGLFWVKNQK